MWVNLRLGVRGYAVGDADRLPARSYAARQPRLSKLGIRGSARLRIPSRPSTGRGADHADDLRLFVAVLHVLPRPTFIRL